MILLLPTLFFILAMIFEGITHAILYSGESANALKGKEHILFNLERLNWGALFLSGLFLAYSDSLHFSGLKLLGRIGTDAAFIGVFSWLSLSTFHNGAYGVGLAKIANKDKSWFSLLGYFIYTSDHDKAKFSYTFGDRIWLAAFGALILIVGIITHNVQ